MTPLKFDWSTYFPKSTLESSFNVSNVFSWDYVGFQNILLLHFTSRIRAHKKETLSSFIHLLGNVCLEHAKPTKCSPISLNVGLKTSMASNFRNSSLLKCQQLRHIQEACFCQLFFTTNQHHRHKAPFPLLKKRVRLEGRQYCLSQKVSHIMGIEQPFIFLDGNLTNMQICHGSASVQGSQEGCLSECSCHYQWQAN